MEAVPQYRQFAYALLATAAAIGAWLRSFQSADGGWIFWGSVGLFAVLFALDWLVATRAEPLRAHVS